MYGKKLIALALSGVLLLSACGCALAADETVIPWWAEAEAYVTRYGLMNSTDKSFQPEEQVTRATVFQSLYNLAGQPAVAAPATFPDVSDDAWYQPSAAWAEAVGLVRGDGADYAGNRPVTREEVATILYRYAQSVGEGFQGAWMYRLPFADLEDISDWAFEAVAWCNMKQVMTGKAGDLADPQGLLTRAELAVMLTAFHPLVQAKSALSLTDYLKQTDQAWFPTGELAAPVGETSFACFVPLPYTVTVTTAAGKELQTNLSGSNHGLGDYLLCSAGKDGKPDLTGVWVVDGESFPITYDRSRLPVIGTVTEIEKYGHAVLDVSIADFNARGFVLGDVVTVTAGSYTGDMPYLDGYYVDSGEAMLRAYPGKSSLAVCINYGKFNEVSGVQAGSDVTITLKEKGGALTTQTIYSLKYTNLRTDYASDEIFSNFRPIAVGDIAEGRLYRSASPVNDENLRAATADRLAEAAGVKAVMNLADTEEEVRGYIAADGFASAYYQSLFEQGGVIALGMPVNYASDEFASGIVSGLTFLSEREGPYLIHCTEGKDRAGFAAALVEALMGASQEEIVTDYMLSYVNYYHIDPAVDRNKYDLIAQNNILEMLRAIAGLEKNGSLENLDLAKAAENYLSDSGMAPEALAALKTALSAVPAAVVEPAQ